MYGLYGFWSGVLQMCHKGSHLGKSSFFFLPMIDMDASNVLHVYSTLCFVSTPAKKYNSIPKFRKVINLIKPRSNTNSRNTDPWTYQRWNQVPRRSKHPLLTGYTHREPYLHIRLSLIKYIQIRLAEQTAVKVSVSKSGNEINRSHSVSKSGNGIIRRYNQCTQLNLGRRNTPL